MFAVLAGKTKEKIGRRDNDDPSTYSYASSYRNPALQVVDHGIRKRRGSGGCVAPWIPEGRR
jgi:hypothetical protein